MLRFLLDTDHLTLYERGQPTVVARVDAQPLSAVGVSAITVEESLRGRLAVVARARDGASRVRSYAQLLGSLQLLTEFVLVPFDQPGEAEFQQLIGQRLRLGTQDLKIAAVALANRLTLVTRNRHDFARVPGLTLEDWSV